MFKGHNIGLFCLEGFILFSMVEGFLIYSTGASIAKILGDVLFLGVLLDFIATQKIISTKIPHFAVLLFSVMLFYVAWGYFNGNSLYVLFQMVRKFKYVLLIPFIISYNYKSDLLFKFVKILLWLSIPVSIVQRVVSSDVTGDDVMGVFSGSGVVSTIIILFFSMEHYQRVTKGKPIFGLHWWWLVPMLINETKYSMVVFIVLLVVPFLLFRRIKMSTIILVPFLLVIGVYASSYAMDKLYGQPFSEIFSKEYLDHYFNADWEKDMGRATKYRIGWDIISSKKKSNFLLGYGLGSTYSGFVNGHFGNVAVAHQRTILFKGTLPEIFLSLINYGVLGVSLILIGLFYLLHKSVRYSSIDSGFLFFSVIMLLTSIPYNNVFIIKDIMTPVFVSIGIYYRRMMYLSVGEK